MRRIYPAFGQCFQRENHYIDVIYENKEELCFEIEHSKEQHF